MTSQFKYGLFLSHSWANKEFVKTFKAKVEAKGVKCWIDDERMAPGDYLFDEIRIAVDGSQVFAAFVSEDYVQSDNCNKEFSLAVDWNRPILPIRLIDGQWPPQGKVALGLAGKLYLDVRNGIIDDNALEKHLKRAGLLPKNTVVVDSTDTNNHDYARVKYLEPGSYKICLRLRHGLNNFCFNVAQKHEIHEINNPVITWKREANAVNEAFYVDYYGERGYLIRAMCCADGAGGSPPIDLFVAPNKDNKLIVSKERFYWRIIQEGPGHSLSPAEMSDADQRVEVFYLFTAYLARPTLVKKRNCSQGHAVFSFMRIDAC